MTNSGYVKKINENKTAVVVFKRESACGGNCSSCSGCSASEIEATVVNEIGAMAGDYVTVESDAKSVLLSAFIMYIIPVVSFIVLYFVFEKYGKFVSVFTAVAGFFISFIFPKLRGKKIDGEIKITQINSRR